MRRRRALLLIGALAASACGDRHPIGIGEPTVTQTASPSLATLAELVHSRQIRIAFDWANSMFLQWDGRQPTAGFHLDLARVLAHDLGVSIEPFSYGTHDGQIAAIRRRLADVALVESDAASGIAFSDPYCIVEYAMLVPSVSQAAEPTDLDRSGARILTYTGTVIERYLTDRFRQAVTIGTTANRPGMAGRVTAGQAEAWADQRVALRQFLGLVPGGRILDPPVVSMRSAFAVADGRNDLLQYLNHWIGLAKSSGLIAGLLERYQLRDGVAVAP